MMGTRNLIFGLIAFAVVFALVGIVSAQMSSFAGYANYQARPSFQAIYGAEGRLGTYWPILGDKDTCQARQDLLLQVSPAGCTPTVVRSDLLAEQNVPVFCQIDALQINPLIDIEKIRGIRFSGKYPNEVISAGFHPARAALRSRDRLLGSPLINNIGYVVVILKKNPVEKNLPEFVKVNLTAQIDYEADNAFGVGKAEFLLEPMSDEKWEENKFKQSFWNGRYFARLENADPNSAIVSIYSGDRKIASTKVNRGETSRVIYVPGAYCRAGVSVAYDGFVAAEKMGIIQLSDDKGTDIIDVYEGSRFLNDRCSVEKININSDNRTGGVTVRCTEGQRIELRIGSVSGVTSQSDLYLSENYIENKKIDIYFDSAKKEISKLYLKDTQIHLNDKVIGNIDIINNKNIINLDKTKFDEIVNSFKEEEQSSYKNLFDALNKAIIENNKIILNKEKIEEKKLAQEEEKKFNEAIEALVKVSDEYPAEREKDVEGSARWGEMALIRAIEISEKGGKEKTRVELLRRFIELYPDSANVEKYKYDLRRISSEVELSEAGRVINVDNKFYNVRLIDLKEPTKQSSADFAISGIESGNVHVELTKLENLTDKGVGTVDSIRLDRIESEEEVSVTINCRDKKSSNGNGYDLKSKTERLRLNEEARQVCDKAYIRLKNVEIEEIAKVRLLPHAQGTRTETNLSVNIGIEKRAIKLSPDKTEEMIENLNKSIKRWESINQKLGQVVSGLKGACFATAGVLTVKNFLTGISGEALARQKVMPGWTRECSDLVSAGKYVTLDACYLDKRNEINNDVEAASEAVGQINSNIENIEKNYPSGESNIFGKQGVDRTKAAIAYCNDLKTRYGTRTVETKTGQSSTVGDLLGDCESGYNNGLYGYNELREMEYNMIMQGKGVSSGIKEDVDIKLKSNYDQISDNRERDNQIQAAKQLVAQGLPSPIVATSSVRKNVVGEVVSVSGVKEDGLKKVVPTKDTHLAGINVYNSKGTTVDGRTRDGFDGGNYYLGMVKDSEGYSVQDVFVKEDSVGYRALNTDEKAEFLDIYGIGRITASDSVSYVNSYKNPEVRYYEREPYKGMPAIVPFDTKEGWYAATRQTLPAFGGIGAFDASGRVTSFYLCNVGQNGQEQFYEGYGDDICQLINLNTGQPLGVFPGLSETEAKRRVGQAVQAIQDAANQYGKGIVRINGRDFNTGRPAAGIPSTQCQNFMSPEECALLFNVCDPVICPSSRCDFGGRYPVADVVQTGIIGSTLLCLPNFVGLGGDVAIPVCLTGIHAGIEGFVSILRNHRDCLQESLATGSTVGICDQIYSVYLCEFFWRQIAPVAKVILPKIIESAYGRGTRGGGEYLTVTAAWQNMQDSVNYFTQSYAVNSVKAFRARSIEEVGAPFCKAFISAKGPKSFKALVQPDSPPQFHAWFSATRFTDATVPATSQYKVFYHIFAGKDQGVYYSVYLKNPPESGFYSIPAVVHVASGFVGKGQYATESKDFTAPEGYQELCVRVNDQEECGFKEVSTSFAVNYLRDKYVESEADPNKNVKSESECVSGSPNLGAAVLSPNIQANLEEAALPKVYDRGIVRICASKNPGSQTDPIRFVDVGYCDDQKIRCWLDKESVKNAITDNNKGVQDATLSEIEKRQRAELAQKGIIVGDDVAVAEIKELKEAISVLREKGTVGDKRFSETVTRLDALLGRVVLNHYKANILYLVGELRAIEFEKVVARKVTESKAAEAKKTSGEAGGGGTSGATPTPPSSGQGSNNVEYVLSGEYNDRFPLKIIERKGYEEKVILEIDRGIIYPPNSNVLIGNVKDKGEGSYYINLIESDIENFRTYFKDNNIDITNIDLYFKFKDAIIRGKDIELSETGQAASIGP